MMTATKSKITDLLAELDTAFEAADAKRSSLAKVHQDASYAIQEAQKDFDTVKAEQAKKVNAATEASALASERLEKARQAVNAVIGQPSDPRVSVR
jgi:predicted  nucleic acid-binding Zn-ribbon protein